MTTQLPPTAAGPRSYSYDPDARMLVITTARVDQAYEVVPLDDGGFRLVREGAGGEHYDVTLGGRPALDLCDCPAGRHGRACKHVLAVRHMRETGLI